MVTPLGGPQPVPEPSTKEFWTDAVKDDSGDAMKDYRRHARNFLDCVKSRKQPVANLESGHQGRHCLSPGQHLPQNRPQTRLGRHPRRNRRRQRSQRHARAPLSGAMGSRIESHALARVRVYRFLAVCDAFFQ
jgi:hypothetical protein